MSSLNQVQLIGRLGADPESRAMPSGEAVANLSMATSEKWKDKSGAPQERTEWHRVAFFGRIAEVCTQYLSKGDLIFVSGSLRTRKWTDKQGVERYSTEVTGREMKMLHTKGRDSVHPNHPSQPESRPAQAESAPNDFDDDIPF